MTRVASTRIIVFAKAPIPGFAKTRLADRLGPHGAAALHARMIAHAVGQACEAAPHAVELACTPSIDHPLFDDLARRHGLELTVQGEGDLGSRMYRAIAGALNDVSRVIIIGTDCPGLDAAYLREAMAVLEAGEEIVLGPAEDGGYVLVGATSAVPRMFEQIAWSTASVLDDTRLALRACRLSWFELSSRWDVDRPDDFERLLREYPGLATGPARVSQPEQAM